jgi:hypothetical protein
MLITNDSLQHQFEALYGHRLYCSVYSRCKISEYKTTVSEKRLGKHVPAESNTHVTIDLLWKQGVFYVVRAEMLWAGQFEATSSVELCKGGWEEMAL